MFSLQYWAYCRGPRCLRELVDRMAWVKKVNHKMAGTVFLAETGSLFQHAELQGIGGYESLVQHAKLQGVGGYIKFVLTRRAPRGRRIQKVWSNTPSSKGSADIESLF